MSKLRTAYANCVMGAKVRNIPWLFTYEEWLQFWIDSGHLHERGCRKGQYCMARFEDKGPYAYWNVKIILHTDNIKERKWSEKEYARRSEQLRHLAKSQRGIKWGKRSNNTRKKLSEHARHRNRDPFTKRFL